MNKIKLLVAFLVCAISMSAQTFVYSFKDQSYFFSVLDAGALTVQTAPITSLNKEITSFYVPEQVQYDNRTYTVTEVGRFSFSSITKIYYLELPKTISVIQDDACVNSTGLAINFWKSIDLKTIGKRAFRYTASVAQPIPPSVTSIGEYAFANTQGPNATESPAPIPDFCFFENSMKEFSFNGAVETIGESAFADCLSLKKLTLPNTLKSVGKDAFKGCTAIESITYPADQPQEFAPDLFEGNVYTSATLYVPIGALEAYKDVVPWKYFINIKEDALDGIGKLTTTSEDGIDYSKPYEVYNLSGIFTSNTKENLAKGIYIVRQGKKSEKIIVK